MFGVKKGAKKLWPTIFKNQNFAQESKFWSKIKFRFLNKIFIFLSDNLIFDRNSNFLIFDQKFEIWFKKGFEILRNFQALI